MEKFILFAAFIVGLAAVTPPPTEPNKIQSITPSCDVYCPKTGSPMCGAYNGQYRLFASSCQASDHYCHTGEVYLPVDMQFCSANVCPIPCPAYDYETICAMSGELTRMFTGLCHFLNFACNDSATWTRVFDSVCFYPADGTSE